MRSWLASAWFSSMLILTSRTLPPCARTTFSSMRRELLARPAPRRPEVDQHRHGARGFDDVLGEGRRGRVLDRCRRRRRRFRRARFAEAKHHGPSPSPSWACSRLTARYPAPATARMRGSWPQAADEPDEVLARDVGRRRVLQRMVVEPLVAHHIGIQDHRHAAALVVDEGERRHRARRHTQHLHQQLRPAEAQAVGAQLSVQGLEVDMCAAQRHDKDRADPSCP